jgi:hypothetical protein
MSHSNRYLQLIFTAMMESEKFILIAFASSLLSHSQNHKKTLQIIKFNLHILRLLSLVLHEKLYFKFKINKGVKFAVATLSDEHLRDILKKSTFLIAKIY